MFTPTKKIAKIMPHWSTLCYVFSDGIVIQERRQMIEDGATLEYDVWHHFPCQIPITGVMHDKDTMHRSSPWPVNFAMIGGNHLMEGIARLEIHFNDSTGTSREAGVFFNTATIYTPSGCEIPLTWLPGLTRGGCTVGNDPTDRMDVHRTKENSAAAFITCRANVITYPQK